MFTGGGHHQASLFSLIVCVWFTQQLVSCVYLLPFQLDRDNRGGYLDWGLCHHMDMVATAEVMLWKENGALLFPLSTLKHKWLRWLICPKDPGCEDQRQAADHLELLLAVDLVCRGRRRSGKRSRSTVPLIPILIFVRTLALWVRILPYFQCVFSKLSVSHLNLWRWVIGEKRPQFKDKSENSACKSLLH